MNLEEISLPDPHRVASLLAEVAQAEIVPRFQRLSEADWREKGPGDIVTVADERAEAILTPQLQALLPGSVVLGEEAAARDPSLMGLLRDPRPVWIIDPVDGTANFAAGKTDFCSMLALVYGDRVLAGWIHEPLNGRTTIAIAGQGIEAIGPARNLTPPDVISERAGSLKRGVIAVGHKGSKDLLHRALRLKEHVEQIRSLRCAGLDYLRLAARELDFLLFSGVMPWDHAAGALIIQETHGLAGHLGDKGVYLASTSATAEGILATAVAADWAWVTSILDAAA
ncbi:MAG: inositol monophosphatase [Dongiaceae bacterium]